MIKIDTSFVQNNKVVVMCSSKKEADILYRNVIKDYPGYRLQDILLPKIRQFMIERDGYGTCYRIQKLGSGFDCGYADKTWYEEAGYEVLDFKSLTVSQDYGELNFGFDNQDAAIAALF